MTSPSAYVYVLTALRDLSAIPSSPESSTATPSPPPSPLFTPFTLSIHTTATSAYSSARNTILHIFEKSESDVVDNILDGNRLPTLKAIDEEEWEKKHRRFSGCEEWGFYGPSGNRNGTAWWTVGVEKMDVTGGEGNKTAGVEVKEEDKEDVNVGQKEKDAPLEKGKKTRLKKRRSRVARQTVMDSWMAKYGNKAAQESAVCKTPQGVDEAQQKEAEEHGEASKCLDDTNAIDYLDSWLNDTKSPHVPSGTPGCDSDIDPEVDVVTNDAEKPEKIVYPYLDSDDAIWHTAPAQKLHHFLTYEEASIGIQATAIPSDDEQTTAHGHLSSVLSRYTSSDTDSDSLRSRKTPTSTLSETDNLLSPQPKRKRYYILHLKLIDHEGDVVEIYTRRFNTLEAANRFIRKAGKRPYEERHVGILKNGGLYLKMKFASGMEKG